MAEALPVAQVLLRKGDWGEATEFVTLDYDARFLRRKKLVCDSGLGFVVDLAKTTSLEAGDALQLADGRLIEVRAAAEDVLVVTGYLARLAWHIGNRHTPCQVEDTRLVIQRDPVIRHMLEHLDAQICEAVEPFTPEGGAYGHGRTHSHEHGASAHDHGHDHGRSHDHSGEKAHSHAH
ncbi:Urease accessory protein UreE 1 [Pelagimonas phthalicica]|uniref:Urease accessory protein UreE n=1 Tax=Pelagimonas phthalicica TaxID=1037362 RepID=A0A238J9J9_9RHOB|nr:urease accessory protein UreE [Pelagimonas phthalicica]TDS94073.1 urease accessory protein [Pelagimonas phthalicica]SMX27401.1 Urease accessory protein UreE 1 [Pelagimonas phthalicica]